MALHTNASVAVRRLDYLEGRRLAHPLRLGRFVLATDQALDRVHGIRSVGHSLPLRDLSNEAFAFISEADHAGSRAAPLFVRHDLHRAAFKNGDAAIGGT